MAWEVHGLGSERCVLALLSKSANELEPVNVWESLSMVLLRGLLLLDALLSVSDSLSLASSASMRAVSSD